MSLTLMMTASFPTPLRMLYQIPGGKSSADQCRSGWAFSGGAVGRWRAGSCSVGAPGGARLTAASAAQLARARGRGPAPADRDCADRLGRRLLPKATKIHSGAASARTAWRPHPRGPASWERGVALALGWPSCGTGQGRSAGRRPAHVVGGTSQQQRGANHLPPDAPWRPSPTAGPQASGLPTLSPEKRVSLCCRAQEGGVLSRGRRGLRCGPSML